MVDTCNDGHMQCVPTTGLMDTYWTHAMCPYNRFDGYVLNTCNVSLRVESILFPVSGIVHDVICNFQLRYIIPYDMIMIPRLPLKCNVMLPCIGGYSSFKTSYHSSKIF